MSWCCWISAGCQLLYSTFLYLLYGIIGGLIFLPIFLLVRKKFRNQKEKQRLALSKFSIGLFHPYCNAGGGGERVLWCALKALAERFPNHHYVIYTGDVGVSRQQFLDKVNSNFNITLAEDLSIEFIYLTRRNWIEAVKYPYFTLLGQSLGSIWLGLEALCQFVPDVYIDTMGYAFTMPLFKYFGQCHVGCYTHYPTISTDMLSLITSRTESYNNTSIVVKSPILSEAKLIYYKIFAWLYSNIGYYSSDVVMVNSSWTLGHINSLWKCPKKTFRVYPPCNVKEFQGIERSPTSTSTIKIISIAQFRPEKNYQLQIESMAALKEILSPDLWSETQLVCIGSCRDQGDRERVEQLKQLALKLEVDHNVVFKVNAPFSELLKEMSEGGIGIHTMWNEHFGIGIVESMAAGLIMVANNSGGPMMDIINTSSDSSRTGFLASTKTEYAECLKQIINMDRAERNLIIQRARSSIERFSDKQFNKEFINALGQIKLNFESELK